MMYERIQWAQPRCNSTVLNGDVWFAEPYPGPTAVVPRRYQIWIQRERAIYEGGRTARVTVGQAAAEPAIPFMKSRRRITSPKGSGVRRLLLKGTRLQQGFTTGGMGSDRHFAWQ